MTDVVKAGLVGCGSLSQRGVLPHLSLPDARKKIHLAAVADVVEERAQESAARFGVPAYYGALDDMLDAEDLDLVLVITPIPYHFENAITAIEAGKHVYVQKAMTETYEQACQLLSARDSAGVKLAAAPGYDLFPLTTRMRRLVKEKVLGHIPVTYTYTMGFGHEHEAIRAGDGVLEAIDPSWYYRQGGGPLPDVTIYSLQLITSILGPVRRVTALSNKTAPERTWQGKTIPVEIDDNNLVLMEFDSGTLGVATGSNCRGSTRLPWGGLELFGTAGTLTVTDVNHVSGYPIEYQIEGGIWDVADKDGAAQRGCAQLADQPYIQGKHLEIEEPHVYADIMDLVDAIHENRSPVATGEQAAHVVELIEKAQAAARTGQTETLESSF